MGNLHRVYQGLGPEVAWIGAGSEVCALGYENDKYEFLRHGRFDILRMGMRMGFLLPVVDAQGQAKAVSEAFLPENPGELKPVEAGSRREVALDDTTGLQELSLRWKDYLYRHTGIRSLSPGEADWTPSQFPTRQDLRTHLPEPIVKILSGLGLKVEIVGTVAADQARQEHEWFWKYLGLTGPEGEALRELSRKAPFYEVVLENFLTEPFPFKIDLGAPLPLGWQKGLVGLSVKEVKGLNSALVLAHEAVYRALLNAGLHPGQRDLKSLISPALIGLYLGSGIGPHDEQQRMFFDTFTGQPTGAKVLANSIANIAGGYISARLGIKGKISTHVGACETCLGSIADAYRDLKAGLMRAAIAGGFDDVMTAASYNGFTSNMAFTTNEKVVENIAAMIEEGALNDSKIQKQVQTLQKQAAELAARQEELEKNYKEKRGDFYSYQRDRKELREKRRLVFLNLPKELAALSSMPFSKYRSGFVMGVGAGAGVLMRLEDALEFGLPVRALLAGVSAMVPDSGEDGSGSIAALGDGVGDAYERAFAEAKANYRVGASADNQPERSLQIEDIGVWFAHGTSTPLNGYGERKEIERVHRKLGRSSTQPILVTGDKAEVGHRIAGNFPSLVGYIFEHNEILPVGNYLQTGFSPQGRRGFGESLDALFPSSAVVGKAGVGAGKSVPYAGDYIAVNGAGFGRINTVLIFRRFRLEEVEMSAAQKSAYLTKRAQTEAQSQELQKKILFNSEALVR